MGWINLPFTLSTTHHLFARNINNWRLSDMIVAAQPGRLVGGSSAHRRSLCGDTCVTIVWSVRLQLLLAVLETIEVSVPVASVSRDQSLKSSSCWA